MEKIYSSKPLKGVKYLKISGCEFLENLNLYQVFPDLRYLYVDDCLLQNLSLPRTLEILFITNNAEKINQLIIPDECKQIVLSGKGVSLPVESLWIPATYDEQSILKQVKTDSWNVLSRILENDEGLILYNEKDKVLQLNEQKLTKNKVRKYTPEGVDRNQYDIASFKANAQSIKSMYTEPKKLILYECEFNSNCTYVLVDDKTVTNFQIIRAKNLSKVGLIQNNELKSVEFTECNNLTYIDVEKFEKLEEIVFNNCEGLNGFQVLKDQGLNLVKKLIFKDCTNLSTVMIQELPSLESISLAGCNGLNTLRLLVLTNLKTLVLPRSKKDILKLDNIRSCNKDLSIEWK